jgi:hypothetical protein
MGNYRAAIALGRQTGQTPDVTLTRTTGAVKYGFAFNLEQPLADDGETGLFARGGWNDGATETFAYTEADRTISLGAQIAGAADTIGQSCARHDRGWAVRHQRESSTPLVRIMYVESIVSRDEGMR